MLAVNWDNRHDGYPVEVRAAAVPDHKTILCSNGPRGRDILDYFCSRFLNLPTPWQGCFGRGQRFRQFAYVIEKKLHRRRERAVLKRHDSAWHAGDRQFNGQHLKLGAPEGKSQLRSAKNCEKMPGC